LRLPEADARPFTELTVERDRKDMMQALIMAAMLATPTLVLAADVVGTITILEGPALIYRGSGRLHAAEGVRVEGGDIVETAAASFAQVEFADGSLAQLGPTTRVMGADPCCGAGARWPASLSFAPRSWPICVPTPSGIRSCFLRSSGRSRCADPSPSWPKPPTAPIRPPHRRHPV
jgi:hypothetical protein